MRMYKLEDGSFFFDDPMDIGYCPVCDEVDYLPKYTLVRSSDVRIDQDCASCVSHCGVCGHHRNVSIPYSESKLPEGSEVIDVGTFMKR